VGYEYCVIVEGEMDALSLHEAGIHNVVSVPNGATLGTNNLDYLDNCIDYFTDKEKDNNCIRRR
jgi:twinkle protein